MTLSSTFRNRYKYVSGSVEPSPLTREKRKTFGIARCALILIIPILVHRTYRGELLRQVIQVYRDASMPDYVSMVQCLIILDDPNAVALVLETLSRGSLEDVLMAYQVGQNLSGILLIILSHGRTDGNVLA